MQRALALDRAPTIWTSFRFFLCVPVFALAAATLLAWQGPEALLSRWAPSTLALVHLFTLGVFSSAMAGALMQILPVAAGISLPRANLLSTLVHGLLHSGTLALVAGFLLSRPFLFQWALWLLGAAFALLIAGIAIGARQSRTSITAGSHESRVAIKLALASLAITAALGITLAGTLGWQWSTPILLLTDMHAAWGLLGWIGLLIIGVAYQVIPIFQVTEIYPATLSRRLTPFIASALALWTLTYAGSDNAAWQLIAKCAALALALAYGAFALASVRILRQHKRPKTDTTGWFWYTGLANLLVCALIVFFTPALSTNPITIGVLFLFGFAFSIVNGMLYKIVPFLVWHHSVQAAGLQYRLVPKLKDMQPSAVTMPQYWLHLLSLLLLIAASLLPEIFTYPAAIAMGASALWLWVNLARTTMVYFRVCKLVAAPAPQP